jgi:hypothetical protein
VDALRRDNVGPALPFQSLRLAPRGFDTTGNAAASITLGALTLTSAASLGLTANASLTLGAITLVSTSGSAALGGLINRNVGPMLPFRATRRGATFSSYTATLGDGVIALPIQLVSDATMAQPIIVGRSARQNMGPALDFAPTRRGLTTPDVGLANGTIEFWAITLSGTGSLGINGALSLSLPISLAATASIDIAAVGNGLINIPITLTSDAIVLGYFTAVNVRVRAFARGWFNVNVVNIGEEIILTSPRQYSPYWMTFVDTPPDDWLPLLATFDPLADREMMEFGEPEPQE